MAVQLVELQLKELLSVTLGGLDRRRRFRFRCRGLLFLLKAPVAFFSRRCARRHLCLLQRINAVFFRRLRLLDRLPHLSGHRGLICAGLLCGWHFQGERGRLYGICCGLTHGRIAGRHTVLGRRDNLRSRLLCGSGHVDFFLGGSLFSCHVSLPPDLDFFQTPKSHKSDVCRPADGGQRNGVWAS